MCTVMYSWTEEINYPWVAVLILFLLGDKVDLVEAA